MRFRLLVSYLTLALLCFDLKALACTRLATAAAVKALTTKDHSFCFDIHVSPGEATQLSINQPFNLEIHIINSQGELVVDSFDFGRETATILSPGDFRAEVRPASGPLAVSIPFLMSRKKLTLQTATALREAEEKSTSARRSRKADEITEALRLWERVGDRTAVARMYLLRGDSALSGGELATARTAYEDSLTICEALADSRCIAEAANNSGFASELLGDFGESFVRLRRAANAWNAIGNFRSQGITLSNLGYLLWRTGDFQIAIDYLVRARSILRPRDDIAYTRVVNNLGLCYVSLAELKIAREYYEEATIGFIRNNARREAAKARANLGRTYLLENNLDPAENLLRQALEEATAEADRAAIAGIRSSLGQVLLARHLPGEASSVFLQALETHRALKDKAFQAVDLHYLGLVAWTHHDLQTARANLTRAAEIRSAVGLRDLTGDSLFSLAEIENEAGNRATALELVEKAVRLSESNRVRVPSGALRASYYSRKRRFFDLLVDLTAAPGNPEAPAQSLLAADRGRSRALLDLMAESVLSRQVPAAALHRREEIQRQIDFLSLQLSRAAGDKEAGLRRQVDELVAEDSEIEATTRETLSAGKLGRPLPSIAELQKQLPDETALLEYHLGEHHSYLWVATPAAIRIFNLPPRAEIEAASNAVLNQFGNVLDRKRSADKRQAFERALAHLSDVLLGPLQGIHLPAKLLVAPDLMLARVPFAALRTPNGGPLGLDHDVVQIPSASYLLVGRKPRPPSAFSKTLLALADPVFSPKDPRLTGVESPGKVTDLNLARLPFHGELATVASLIPPSRLRILLGQDATVAALTRERLSRYAFLHLSTHAFVDGLRPELSRVALSTVDRAGKPAAGLLRPNQLATLGLDGSTVVLAACETALGKQMPGEGLVGFTSSLFQAGASQLVLTIAEIDAEASSEFLSQTYKRVLSPHPSNTEHSVRLARVSLAGSTRWRDPYYWASFVVYGQPSTVN